MLVDQLNSGTSIFAPSHAIIDEMLSHSFDSMSTALLPVVRSSVAFKLASSELNHLLKELDCICV